LGDVSNLHDNEMFYNIISEELTAQARYDTKKADRENDPSYIAKTIATRLVIFIDASLRIASLS
jgi:hypothetical protein